MPTNLKQMRKEARRSAPPLKSTIFRPPRLMREKESSIVSVEFIADGLADVEAPFDPCQLDVPLPLPLQARVAALSIRPSSSSAGDQAPTRYAEAWGSRGQRLSYNQYLCRRSVPAQIRAEEKLAKAVEERLARMSSK